MTTRAINKSIRETDSIKSLNPSALWRRTNPFPVATACSSCVRQDALVQDKVEYSFHGTWKIRSKEINFYKRKDSSFCDGSHRTGGGGSFGDGSHGTGGGGSVSGDDDASGGDSESAEEEGGHLPAAAEETTAAAAAAAHTLTRGGEVEAALQEARAPKKRKTPTPDFAMKLCWFHDWLLEMLDERDFMTTRAINKNFCGGGGRMDGLPAGRTGRLKALPTLTGGRTDGRTDRWTGGRPGPGRTDGSADRRTGRLTAQPTGERTDGQTAWRTGGRADGRTDGPTYLRADGRISNLPLLPQGAARAEAEAKAQPLALRRQLPPRARTSIKAARMKAVKEPKVLTRRRCPDPDTVRDRERHFAALPLYSPDSPCAGSWI
jgi:hypothetical protein